MDFSRQIVFDTETTGLYASEGDRIVEFAGVELINRVPTGNNVHVYINPERDMPEEAFRIHGLSAEFLADKPTFEEVGQEIFDFLNAAEIIAHNAPFDVAFLNSEFARMNLPAVETVVQKVTDTLQMARERYPGQKNSLDALCSRLEIDRSKRVLHGALIDCELLSEVYLAMTRNQFSLDMGLTESSDVLPDEDVMVTRPEYLRVILANQEELLAHEAYLDGLDKASSGNSLYRNIDS